MSKGFIKGVTEIAHKHEVYECKQLGLDTIELNVGSLQVPEEVPLRFVRLIKGGGLKAKCQFSVTFNKADIPVVGDRAFGAHVESVPLSSELVENIDLIIRRAERWLEAGADMIMIEADDVWKHADCLRMDFVA